MNTDRIKSQSNLHITTHDIDIYLYNLSAAHRSTFVPSGTQRREFCIHIIVSLWILLILTAITQQYQLIGTLRRHAVFYFYLFNRYINLLVFSFSSTISHCFLPVLVLNTMFKAFSLELCTPNPYYDFVFSAGVEWYQFAQNGSWRTCNVTATVFVLQIQ